MWFGAGKPSTNQESGSARENVFLGQKMGARTINPPSTMILEECILSLAQLFRED